jgi:hypothetical protein
LSIGEIIKGISIAIDGWMGSMKRVEKMIMEVDLPQE